MRHEVRTAFLLLLSALTPCLIGCSGFFVYPGTTGSGGSSSTSYVYVANATTSTIAAYGLGTGALVAVSGSPYTLALSPTAIVVTPANKFLYAGGVGAIFGYSINTSTGQLTPLSSGAALAAVPVASMDVSPDGSWLLVLDASGVTVDEYAIDSSSGALTPATGASFAVTGGDPLPRMIKFSPNGAYAVAAMGTGGEVVFTFNTTTGALVASQVLAGSATTSDNGITIDANSAFLYVARSGDNDGVAVFSIGNAGALASVSGSPFGAGGGPYSVVLDSAGTHAYVANRTDGTISGYTVATGGILTAITGSPYTTGSLPNSLGRDSTGKYLVAASFGGSSDLTMYTFDATTAGKLNVASTVATGTDPTGPIALALTH